MILVLSGVKISDLSLMAKSAELVSLTSRI
jgi:hypothetical protein